MKLGLFSSMELEGYAAPGRIVYITNGLLTTWTPSVKRTAPDAIGCCEIGGPLTFTVNDFFSPTAEKDRVDGVTETLE